MNLPSSGLWARRGSDSGASCRQHGSALQVYMQRWSKMHTELQKMLRTKSTAEICRQILDHWYSRLPFFHVPFVCSVCIVLILLRTHVHINRLTFHLYCDDLWCFVMICDAWSVVALAGCRCTLLLMRMMRSWAWVLWQKRRLCRQQVFKPPSPAVTELEVEHLLWLAVRLWVWSCKINSCTAFSQLSWYKVLLIPEILQSSSNPWNHMKPLLSGDAKTWADAV